ncbi:MAG: hypothetical protein O3C65_15655 [Proteobacteria bacterium]|nr:hypothetical protein [Pseudomonadota bacterium]
MRILLGLLAVYWGFNGSFMLAAPAAWFAAVPGAHETGAFNPHFVQDAGIGFLAAATALALAIARREVSLRLVAVATVFLGGHALLHLWDLAVHRAGPSLALVIVVTVVVPAALGVWPLVRARALPGRA